MLVDFFSSYSDADITFTLAPMVMDTYAKKSKDRNLTVGLHGFAADEGFSAAITLDSFKEK